MARALTPCNYGLHLLGTLWPWLCEVPGAAVSSLQACCTNQDADAQERVKSLLRVEPDPRPGSLPFPSFSNFKLKGTQERVGAGRRAGSGAA